MKYAEHLTVAIGMNEQEIRRALHALAVDPNFTAVVALIELNRHSWSTAVAAQNLADSHGRLAHAAGSLHALEVLQSQLVAALSGRALGSRGLGASGFEQTPE